MPDKIKPWILTCELENLEHPLFKCPDCGKILALWRIPESIDFRYCPFCGARRKEE